MNRRDWVIKSNDDSLEKNGKLIPRSIYVYIYIQNHKRPRHHPESSGYFNQKKVDCATRDHTFNHPFEQTASICTRNPSRWNTSRSRSSRGTLFVINSLQLTSFAPMEFTVLGDRPERERGEEDYPGGGQERVTCPRHLQFFFSCLAPARCPRSQPVSHRPVGRNGAKISLKLIERGCCEFLGTGGTHTIVVSWINYRLTYVSSSPCFFFKYSSPKNSKRRISYELFPFSFLLSF